MRKSVDRKIEVVTMVDEDGLVRHVDITIDDRTFELDKKDLWILYVGIENGFNHVWFDEEHEQISKPVNSIEKTA